MSHHQEQGKQAPQEARKRRVYLYGADRERNHRVVAAFSCGGCGAVAC